MSFVTRRPAVEVLPVALSLVKQLEPAARWIEIAGSLRRGKPDIGDVEIVAIPRDGDLDSKRHALCVASDLLLKEGIVTKAQYGAKNTNRWGSRYRGMMYQGIKFELFCCDPFNRGYIFALRTGPDNSKDRANTFLMVQIKKSALFKVDAGYVWYQKQKLKIEHESDWFALLGLPYIEPHERSTKIYAKLFGRGHRWGDPEQFLIRQQTLFDFRAAQEFELAKASSGVKPEHPPAPPFEWCAPWLESDGQVWVYRGYGQYELFPQSDPAAVTRLAALRKNAFRYAEAERLQAWLKLRESAARFDMLADVLSEALSILREEMVYA